MTVDELLSVFDLSNINVYRLNKEPISLITLRESYGLANVKYIQVANDIQELTIDHLEYMLSEEANALLTIDMIQILVPKGATVPVIELHIHI